VKNVCIGCEVCIVTYSVNAISETKKEVGVIYIGKNYSVDLIIEEFKLGELASGEVVNEVRKHSEKINKKLNPDY